MAHQTARNQYDNLSKRLNNHPQGAPPSELLYKILSILFSEKEAKLVAKLPIKPFTADIASNIWKLNIKESKKILDELASRAILVDIKLDNDTEYVLPPPMAGFFEFSLMRVRNDIDQKLLSELFYQYLNVEEDFVKDLFTKGETQLGRIFVNESVLTNENAMHVLSYEKATEVIETAEAIGISMCYCRHKMMHLGKNCDAPMDICMTFNTSAASLVRHGHARSVSKNECMDLLHKAWDHNLVQFGENVQNNVNFICNCCPCCCEAMLAAQRFSTEHAVHTTSFIVESKVDDCNGCGKCIDVCPIKALSLVSAENPDKPKLKRIEIDESLCLGCGVCLRNCKTESLTLKSRPERILTPVNVVHRTVVMAIERGNLAEVLFDNKALFSHRVLAAVIGSILKLPPIKQIVALKQVKSRYLEKIITAYIY
ncbi:MAG: 4Fe-4S dicluster domain-containing protein [Desulfobacterales bacterium]|nr:4Fe-4S dicluster domain-containing protein [Desulfobacterales bacterium]MCP4158736.1 4Fe-4S dicluster domain-containing protein [Deltaproteobacteria bacterium]